MDEGASYSEGALRGGTTVLWEGGEWQPTWNPFTRETRSYALRGNQVSWQ